MHPSQHRIPSRMPVWMPSFTIMECETRCSRFGVLNPMTAGSWFASFPHRCPWCPVSNLTIDIVLPKPTSRRAIKVNRLPLTSWQCWNFGVQVYSQQWHSRSIPEQTLYPASWLVGSWEHLAWPNSIRYSLASPNKWSSFVIRTVVSRIPHRHLSSNLRQTSSCSPQVPHCSLLAGLSWDVERETEVKLCTNIPMLPEIDWIQRELQVGARIQGILINSWSSEVRNDIRIRKRLHTVPS